MADYYTPTVITPDIPVQDISQTNLEILKSVYEWEMHDENIYFFSQEGRRASIPVTDDEGHEGEIEIEDDDVCKILQDVVKGSDTINQINIISSFTCNKMRPDGFGGGVVVITQDDVRSFSTDRFIEACQAK